MDGYRLNNEGLEPARNLKLKCHGRVGESEEAYGKKKPLPRDGAVAKNWHCTDRAASGRSGFVILVRVEVIGMFLFP